MMSVSAPQKVNIGLNMSLYQAQKQKLLSQQKIQEQKVESVEQKQARLQRGNQMRERVLHSVEEEEDQQHQNPQMINLNNNNSNNNQNLIQNEQRNQREQIRQENQPRLDEMLEEDNEDYGQIISQENMNDIFKQTPLFDHNNQNNLNQMSNQNLFGALFQGLNVAQNNSSDNNNTNNKMQEEKVFVNYEVQSLLFQPQQNIISNIFNNTAQNEQQQQQQQQQQQPSSGKTSQFGMSNQEYENMQQNLFSVKQQNEDYKKIFHIQEQKKEFVFELQSEQNNNQQLFGINQVQNNNVFASLFPNSQQINNPNMRQNNVNVLSQDNNQFNLRYVTGQSFESQMHSNDMQFEIKPMKTVTNTQVEINLDYFRDSNSFKPQNNQNKPNVFGFS